MPRRTGTVKLSFVLGRGALLALLGALAQACGGSSSETPYPLEPLPDAFETEDDAEAKKAPPAPAVPAVPATAPSAPAAPAPAPAPSATVGDPPVGDPAVGDPAVGDPAVGDPAQ